MPEKIVKVWGSKGANEPQDPHAWRYIAAWSRTAQGSLEVLWLWSLWQACKTCWPSH